MNALIFYTADLEPCFDDTQNPDFKEVLAFTDDESGDVEIDDFIGLGGVHTWENLEYCGK